MALRVRNLVLFLCVVSALVATLPTIVANIGTFDRELQKRAEEAYEESLQAFKPNPEKVTDEFNKEVSEALMSKNVTRRHLKQGGCQASNPIDSCWRCDPYWANDRKKLADCARGFGHDSMGGKNGRYYTVTDASDDEMDHPRFGTLRYAIIQKEPLWITFAHSMVIKLKQELIFTSDKTIDGRGVQVRIANGAGLTLQFVHNIIIHNIWIHDIIPTSGGMIRDTLDHIGLRTKSAGDGINIFSSSHVWIDHVSLAKGHDGLIDVVEGSTAITISNCKFNHHNDVMLLGASDHSAKDAIMQVTVAFNRFGMGLIQRMPRVRWGFAHVVNNDYFNWELYAIGGSAHPTIVSQGNRFRASDNPFTKQVTKRDYAPPAEWQKWQWRSEGDLFLNGAYFVESGPPLTHTKTPLTGQNLIKFQPSAFVGKLTRDAGAIRCRAGTLC